MSALDLHVHSTFSIKDGLGTPKAIVARAKELGWNAVCLTDHGWLGGIPALYQAARAEGLNPIIGCEMYVAENEILGERGRDFRWKHHHLTVLALSKEGYHNLVAWTTFAYRRENFYDAPRISMEMMAELAPYPLRHNVVLSGCMSSELARTVQNGDGLDQGVLYIEAMKSLFPNFYVEVQNHARQKFLEGPFVSYQEMVAKEKVVRDQLLALAARTGTPTILTNDSHFQTASQRRAHVAMIAQKRNYGQRVKIEDYLPEYGYFSNYMQSMEQIADRTAGLPEEAISNAQAIADEAAIRLDPLDNFKYSIPFSGYDDPIARIRRRSESRLSRLEGKHGAMARRRFEHELGSMGDFAHYLLLMSDFIINARKQGILTWTRGSAANSLLCYCLKIHDIDSIEYGLLFSRFFNPARKKLPDIDVDIQPSRFDDFMAYVHERMTELEGEGQVAQICNLGTMANRSSFRLIAEALGVPKETQDDISKLLPQIIDSGMVEEENDVYEMLKYEYPEIHELTSGVFDSIKNISQHACGWLFGTKERPISEWIPLCLIASSGTMVTQFDLNALKDIGLVKGDFLRLKTLDIIADTMKAIGKSPLEFHSIPVDDPETFEMIRKGKVEGVHTLQGKENRRGAMECEVETVHDVIRMTAAYRPALTREKKQVLYNQRRKGEKPVEYAHPILEEILGPTYGIPIFQEQVMEIGYALGMDDGEVDEIYEAIKLAKGIGRGAKEAFEKIRPKAEAAGERRGFGRVEVEAVWKEISSSAGYGFNKGHATSYGILAVRSAFLLCHHSERYRPAVLDAYPGKAKYLAAARGDGFQLLPPSVNRSAVGFEYDPIFNGLRTGLGGVKGVGPVAAEEIVQNQPYRDLEDFKERTETRKVNKTRIEALTQVGAFNDLGIKEEPDDTQQFQYLGFTLEKPKALRGIKPRHVGRRVSDRGWVHQGLESGVDYTEGRVSVSKLFWIPPLLEKDIIQLKTATIGNYKSWLLTAIDTNGIPFHVMANEEKEGESLILRFLAKKFRGCVVCLDGALRQPFLNDGPLGFRFYGISGADFNGEPQVWGDAATSKAKVALIELHSMKRRMRAAA